MVAGCTTTSLRSPVTQVEEDAGDSVPKENVSDSVSDQESRAQERDAMVDSQIVARGVSNPLVLRAMRAVPRHEFVTPDYLDQAYDDHPLPIGHGQTISQPYIVAWMSELLEVEPGDKVLEIGTGSGYQAAVLAEMGVEVYTVEVIAELAATAAPLLERLGYQKIKMLEADGYFGWEEHAPYDAIVVTAAPDHLPRPLLLQLAEDGRLVIPVGPVGSFQTLWRFTHGDSDEVLAENLGFVSFVPLTGEGTRE
ncbi:MAG: protein-L-isoaspartate(D-aspartate) O-methyltransferase [Acidobacteria bacterium]|nr:protein-L-isoaspartate(D-aspartate) O-methyltransferase [Acidobacteriota bacterium]